MGPDAGRGDAVDAGHVLMTGHFIQRRSTARGKVDARPGAVVLHYLEDPTRPQARIDLAEIDLTAGP